jgi:protein tyrosine/serine phosphatase
VIRWEGFYNARDLGGLPTIGGGTTRYGELIRSADPRFVTTAGWQSAVDAGFRTVIDLRNDDEAEAGSIPCTTLGAGTFAVPAATTTAQRPAELRSLRIPLDDIDDISFWRHLNEQGLNGTPLYFGPFVEAKPQRIAAVLTAIARARTGGIIFHCGAGRDRAGLLSLLMLSIAGVTADAIVEDYELSLDQVGPLYRALGIEQHEPNMRAELERRGTTVRAVITDLLDGLQVPRLLRDAAVAEVDVAALQSCLLPA